MTIKTIAALAVALPVLCLADATVTMKRQGADETDAVYYVKDGKVLMQGSARDEVAILFDSEDGSLTMMDAENQSYNVIDQKVVDDTASMMQQVMKQMEQQLAQMPEEQREMMKQHMPGMMGSKPKPTFATEPMGETAEVAGVKCKMVRVLKDGEPHSEVCMAKRSALGISEADFETLASMFDRMRAMSGKFQDDSAPMPDLREAGGFPILHHDPEDGSVSELDSVSDDTIDADRFAVPDGFTERTMPTMGPGG